MRVLLLEDIEKVGKKYEVKDVADGYARNYLIPQGKAKLAAKETLEWAKSQREADKRKVEEELVKVGNLASAMDGLEVEIPVKIGDKGQLFEKVNTQKIAARLKELGYDVRKDQIELAEDIEELGEFDAKIKFEHNLEVQIKVVVAAEEGSKSLNEETDEE